MLPVIAAGAMLGWLADAARSEAKAERDASSDLAWDLEETLEELEDCVGQSIAVLDADGAERAGYKGRVHKVVHSKGIVVLDVSRSNKKPMPHSAPEKEFKVWRVRLDESFIELD
jgi:hypothetical protein